MNFKKTMKIDNLLINDRYKAFGDRERYCAEQLFTYINSKSKDYNYVFSPTTTGNAISYDGVLRVEYKHSGTIAAYYIVEIKVRETHYDTLILDDPKLKSLKKEKRAKDKYFKSQWSDRTMGILYINFTDQGTYIFDLIEIEDNKEMPKGEKHTADKVYVDPSQGKVTRVKYKLPLTLATKTNWIFDEQEYMQYLKEDIKYKTSIVKEIKTRTASIF